MNIREVIERNYEKLMAIEKNPDKIISEAKTDEDYLNDVCLTAIKKFRNKDIDEAEGFDYLQKNLRMEMKFKYHRKDKKTSYLEDLPDISNI